MAEVAADTEVAAAGDTVAAVEVAGIASGAEVDS